MENLNLQEEQVIDLLLRGHSTNNIADAMIQARVLSMYKNNPAYQYAKTKILNMRKDWIAWRFDAQREWQTTKSINKFHDSFELREKYIAPHENNWELENAFNKRAIAYNKTIRPQLYKRF